MASGQPRRPAYGGVAGAGRPPTAPTSRVDRTGTAGVRGLHPIDRTEAALEPRRALFCAGRSSASLASCFRLLFVSSVSPLRSVRSLTHGPAPFFLSGSRAIRAGSRGAAGVHERRAAVRVDELAGDPARVGEPSSATVADDRPACPWAHRRPPLPCHLRATSTAASPEVCMHTVVRQSRADGVHVIPRGASGTAKKRTTIPAGLRRAHATTAARCRAAARRVRDATMRPADP